MGLNALLKIKFTNIEKESDTVLFTVSHCDR